MNKRSIIKYATLFSASSFTLSDNLKAAVEIKGDIKLENLTNAAKPISANERKERIKN